jgi:hypothetical protein
MRILNEQSYLLVSAVNCPASRQTTKKPACNSYNLHVIIHLTLNTNFQPLYHFLPTRNVLTFSPRVISAHLQPLK